MSYHSSLILFIHVRSSPLLEKQASKALGLNKQSTIEALTFSIVYFDILRAGKTLSYFLRISLLCSQDVLHHIRHVVCQHLSVLCVVCVHHSSTDGCSRGRRGQSWLIAHKGEHTFFQHLPFSRLLDSKGSENTSFQGKLLSVRSLELFSLTKLYNAPAKGKSKCQK